MTRFRVVVQPQAQSDMLEAAAWIAERAPDMARIWYDNLAETLLSLSTFPERCPLAPENDAFEEEIRQLLFTKHASIYRILFTVQGEEVHVLHVRHGARRYLDEEETESGE